MQSVMAAFLTLVVLFVFDWPLVEVLGGGAAGAVIWGGLIYLIEVSDEVPDAETLPLAPRDAEIQRQVRPSWRVLVLIPVGLGLAWLADHWDFGGFFVPGQFAGYAAANVAGVFAVAGWERRTGGEVLSDGRESLYVSR